MTAPITHENLSTPEKSNRFEFLGKLVQPHASITDPAERRRVRFLATILLLLASLTSVNLPVRLISGTAYEDPVTFFMFLVSCVALFVEYGLCLTKHYKVAPGLAIATLTAIIYGAFSLGGFTSEASLLWLVPILIFASTILSFRDTFLYSAGNLLFLALGGILLPFIAFDTITSALFLLFVSAALILVQVQYRNTIEGIRQEELEKANKELNVLSQSLEVRVQERTQDLALAGELGQAVSHIQNIDELLAESVSLIQDRFNLYYAQIYLVDEAGEKLIMRAGSGEVGQALLAKGHALFIDESSINGRAAASKEAVIVADTEASDFFLPNPLLPDTKSEMAIPLVIQDTVVGVINLQSDETNALSEDGLPAFSALAGQLAVAINNTRLLTETERNTNFLDAVINNLPVMLSVKELDELRFIRLNKAGEKLTGFPMETTMGKNMFDFLPEAVAEQHQSQEREIIAGKEMVEFPEETIQTAHQGIRLLHTFKVPILDERGEPEYLLSISEDITDRKQMERDLAGRVRQLNLLNDIGRQANIIEEVPELIDWVCARIPQTLRYPEECVVAITVDDTLYGDVEAKELPRHIIEELRVSGETIGRIYIAYTDNELNFVDEESALIGGIGRRISSYIETRRLVDQLQNQAADLRKVANISTAVATTRNPTALLQQVTDLTRENFGLYLTAVFLLEDNDLVLTAVSSSTEQDEIRGIRISRNSPKSIVAKAARSQETILVEDVLNDPDYLPNYSLPDTRSELAIPLRAGAELIGILDFQSVEENGFHQEEINVYNTLALQVATSWQNAQQYEQTQLALEELSSLQRVITNESWEMFMANQERAVQGYLAAEHAVKPILADSAETAQIIEDEAATVQDLENEAAYVIPVQVRGTTIGKLGVRGKEGALSEENQALIAAISQQVAEALERARLFEETELARAQTDQLFTGSERVVRAASLDEVLQALVDSTELSRMDNVNMLFFDKNWDEQPPESATVTAVWLKEGSQAFSTPVGTVFELGQMPTTLLNRSVPLLLTDIETAPTLDEEWRASLLQQGTRSIFFFPLVAAGEWIGLLVAQSGQSIQFSAPTIRQISSLVDQAAPVAQTQRLFEAANSRAQQEQILRQVSERVYSAVDAESVLRTAVREVGQALGLEAFIYLDDKTKGTAVTNGTAEKSKKSKVRAKQKS